MPFGNVAIAEVNNWGVFVGKGHTHNCPANAFSSPKAPLESRNIVRIKLFQFASLDIQ